MRNQLIIADLLKNNKTFRSIAKKAILEEEGVTI